MCNGHMMYCAYSITKRICADLIWRGQIRMIDVFMRVVKKYPFQAHTQFSVKKRSGIE